MTGITRTHLKVLKNEWPRVVRAFQQLPRYEVEWGIRQSPTVATYGWFNQTGIEAKKPGGLGHRPGRVIPLLAANSKWSLPARKWMSRTNEDLLPSWTIEVARAMLWNGKLEPRMALHRVANVIRKTARKRLLAGFPPPNAPGTVRKKGHGRTMVDTGRLYKSIQAAVVPAGTNPEAEGVPV